MPKTIAYKLVKVHKDSNIFINTIHIIDMDKQPIKQAIINIELTIAFRFLYRILK